MEDLENIRNIVFRYYGLEPDLINSKIRLRPIVHARQVTHYFSREKTNFSLSQIGWFQGMKDHATVLYGIKSVNNMLDYDKAVQRDIEKLDEKLDNKLNGVTFMIKKDGYLIIHHAKERRSRIK
jgi:chromosomal replication initiator protein